VQKRTETLDYEQTLTALLALIGSPVTVTVTPVACDW